MITNINNYIYEYFEQNINNSSLKEMSIYAINSGGKRFRPLLFLSLFENMEDIDKYMSIAIAIELTHTYSLLHDDLPAMDNDLYRRGKKSLWNMYGENNAILIGDSFITMAIDLISKNNNITSNKKIQLISELIKKSGINGMIEGQYLDVNSKGHTINSLNHMYLRKTGDLIALCFSMYAIINDYCIDKYVILGSKMGILFQYQDDILEMSETFEQSSSDIRNQKVTAVNIFEDVQIEIEKLSHEINNLIDTLNLSNNSIKIIKKILNRGNYAK